MTATFSPSTLSGTVTVPPSKSMSHRAIICAALADGVSRIDNLIFSKDIIATIEAMKIAGADFNIFENSVEITGIKSLPKDCSVDCNESGSTLRFAIPIFCALGIKTEFIGRGKLPTRPITPYLTELTKNGINFDYNNTMPFTVSGKLAAGKFTIDGNISSQFITGLLFSLPLLDGDSEIHINGRLESEPYVNMTIHILDIYGIKVDKTDFGYIVYGNQKYKSANYTVEADFSQAAFFLVGAAIKNNDLACKGLNTNSTQGDKAILEIIKACGCEVIVNSDLISIKSDKLNAFTVDARDIPDLVPILSILACFCEGTSKIENVARLRIKESDRILSTISMVKALGAEAYEENDTIFVVGINDKFSGGSVNSFNDHRIAMSTAIASTMASEEVRLSTAESVNKSYPSFYDDFKKLGGKVNVINVEQ